MERRQRLAIAVFAVGALAFAFYFSLDVPTAERGQAWRNFAIAAALGALLGVVLTALDRRIAVSPAVFPAAIGVAMVVLAVTSRTFDAADIMALEGACGGVAVSLTIGAMLRRR